MVLSCSLSESHSPPPPSLTVTSRGEEQSGYHTADSHSTSATAGAYVNPKLAAAYNLNMEHGTEDKMKITGSAPSDLKGRRSRSKMHHGKLVFILYNRNLFFFLHSINFR